MRLAEGGHALQPLTSRRHETGSLTLEQTLCLCAKKSVLSAVEILSSLADPSTVVDCRRPRVLHDPKGVRWRSAAVDLQA